MSSLRVALVSLHTSPLAVPGTGDAGGLNVYVVALAEALADLGVEVELVTRRTAPAQPALEFTPGGVAVRFLEAGPPRELLKEDLPPIVGRFQSALSVLPRFDVLHSHYWLSGLAALPVATMQHSAHIQSLHTVAAVKNVERAPDDRPEPEARLNAERLLVTRSAASITSTEAEREAIVRDYRARPERVHVVTPGVDTALFHPAPAEGTGAPYLLTLGRIQPLKGYDLAIRTLAAIEPARRPRLVIAGSATPGSERFAEGLEMLAGDLGVAHLVDFVGAQTRDQAAELVRNAALLLLTSHSETYGLVALEAAASGTPTLGTRASGMALSVRDGVSGVLLDGRSPEAWAAAVERLLEHPAALQRLRSSAAAYGSQHSWRRTAEATLTLYRRAAQL
ncbi:glycosyltransferase [Subtercola sp. YIM 133946]|uniref:glycosyltransferase n=1 Tax=Subtercola sp. YIM 133946 TaxID=3118909 RepID=UPI002F93559C